MEELIKQELNYFSNADFSLPSHRALSISRYDRNASFSQISDWTNSNKVSTPKLPRIFSKVDSDVNRNKNSSSLSNHNGNACCPIKQMDINLEPLKHLEESYYCQYLKKKSIRPLKQVEFFTSYEQQRRSSSLGKETVGIGKLQEIIRRQKNSRFNANLDDYLRTTQLFQNVTTSIKK